MIGVPEGSELELDLRLESVVEGVLVSGTVDGHACRASACGAWIRSTATLEVDLQELYAYPGPPGTEPDEDDDRSRCRIDGDLIDLEPALRDAVVLALPLQPLCRDDCPGLCAECGARLADDPDHAHDAVDPRWAALATGTGAEHDRTTDRTDDRRPPHATDRTERGETDPWPSPSGRCRAATPARAARSGRRRRLTLVACDRCREPKLPHIACPTCGTYNGRQVLDV